MQYTLNIDLDDTLIPNSYRYCEPSWKCGLIISQALGQQAPYFAELTRDLSAIDEALLKEKGYSRDRFPLAWIKAYQLHCEKSGVVPSDRVCDELRRVASGFADGPFHVFDGVYEVLTQLRTQGHVLNLVTAGDPSLQMEKIESANLLPYFNGVFIEAFDKKTVSLRSRPTPITFVS